MLDMDKLVFHEKSDVYIEPLLVTPMPFYGECQLGYLQRIAEYNGYRSANFFTQYIAGLYEKILSQKSIQLLAKILNCTESDLSCINLVPHKKKTTMKAKNPVLLGQTINSTNINLSHMKICPLCIKETGFIHIFGHLNWVVSCPVHKVRLINRCINCKNLIKGNSGFLLKCRCGSDFSKYPLMKTNNSHLDNMMMIIWEKLNDQPLCKASFTESKFPIDDFSRMSLNTLLGVLARLENRILKKEKFNIQSLLGMIDIREIICIAFTSWPENFLKFLTFLSCHEKQLYNNSFEELAKITDSLFKSTIPINETVFIKEAITDVHKHIAHAQAWTNPVELNEFTDLVHFSQKNYYTSLKSVASAVGVMTGTARSMIKLGLITKLEGKLNSSRTKKIYLTHEKTPIRKDGFSYSARVAAKMIGLPVSILKLLRKNGTFPYDYIGDKLTSFHQRDVSNFLKKLDLLYEYLKNSYDRVNVEKGDVFLKDLLNKKSLSTEVKVNLIEDLLLREFRYVYPEKFNSVFSLDRLLFQKEEIMEWIKTNT